MQSKDLLKTAIQSSQGMVLPLLEDMKNAPLTFRTPNGGNHPLWVLGHLAYGEGAMLWSLMQGKPNPLAEWKDLFDGGTEPTADAEKYPSFDEVLGRLYELRSQSMDLLDALSEEDLDQPSKNAPEGFEPFFGSYRLCFLMTAMHWMNHRGQAADCRRAVGRRPILA
jgi:hypothetical protein